MKTLTVAIILMISSNTMAQKFDYNSLADTCNPEYVFDYRMIYNDYESSLTELLDVKLTERYKIWVEYFGPDIQEPKEMLISVSLIDNIYISVFMPVCIAEELFQKNILVKYVSDKFHNW